VSINFQVGRVRPVRAHNDRNYVISCKTCLERVWSIMLAGETSYRLTFDPKWCKNLLKGFELYIESRFQMGETFKWCYV
jgi:hypothetical protein